MIEYLLLGLIFTSIFTVKSLFFNYAFSSSYNFIYQMEIIGLITYNSKYVGLKKCSDCFNIFIEWLLLGWLGLPLENETINSIIYSQSESNNTVNTTIYSQSESNNTTDITNIESTLSTLNDITIIIILISWIISFLITLLVKIINYRCKKSLNLTNIKKIILKFCLSNYTPLLLWSMVSFIKETSFHFIKFWFELSNLFLFLFLIFGLKSIILYILYGQNRLYYKSIYMFLHNRFKPRFKLWFFVNLLFKDALILPTCLIVLNNSNQYNYLIVNYLLIFYQILYTLISFYIKPLKQNNRNDNRVINVVNIFTIVYIIFNEFSLYLDKTSGYPLWIIKIIIIFVMTIYVLYACYKNYKIEKFLKISKKTDNKFLLELPTIKEIDV
tara:strand:- start:9308 stop:10462 length:1155 start_codon:yes stop_codon:yes gene_type:complete